MGAVPQATYTEATVVLPPNTLMAVFSDGITEAADERGDLLQEKPVLDTLREGHHESARRVLRRLYDTVGRFSRAGSQTDDRTVIVVKRTPKTKQLEDHLRCPVGG